MDQIKSFNSKLVRLKVYSWFSKWHLQQRFQFQTGSIKSRKLTRVDGYLTFVSIPNWFD